MKICNAIILFVMLACIQSLFGEDTKYTRMEVVTKLNGFSVDEGDYRIYFIGDSITRHGTNDHFKAKLGWDHMAGMAASTQEKDFAHILADHIREKYQNKNIKLFFGNGGNAVAAMKGIPNAKRYMPHLVVIQLGEHVPSKAFGWEYDQSPEDIVSNYDALVKAMVGLPTSPKVICTGSWNPIPGAKQYSGRNTLIDKIQRDVALAHGAAFVSVEKYALDPTCSGTGTNGGVRWHPNDAGHAGYAKEMITVFDKLDNPVRNIGKIVYEENFENDMQGWTSLTPGTGKMVPDRKRGSCVRIQAIGDGGTGVIGNRDVLGSVEYSQIKTYRFLNGQEVSKILSKYKGYEIEIEIGVKGENIPAGLKPWQGAWIAANYMTSTLTYSDCYYNQLHGTFDWKDIKYRTRVPEDMIAMSMNLGLIAQSGSVFYDYVKMTLTDIPLSMKQTKNSKPYTGHGLKRLRGFNTPRLLAGTVRGKRTVKMLAGEIKNRDFKSKEKAFENWFAGQWHANVLKSWFGAKGDDFEKIDHNLKQWISDIEDGLETMKENNVYLILQLSTSWKAKGQGGNDKFYEDPKYVEKIIEIWKTIAEHFKGRKEIYAFELLNESQLRMTVADECDDYSGLVERIAQEINKVDPDRSIIIQPEEWWGTRAFNKLRPVNAKNVIYAVHFYSPFAVTHQGVGAYQAGKKTWTQRSYPGTYDRVLWNKETLRRDLQPAINFQKAYGVHMIVSEFSCVRWTPDETRYNLLKDMIDLFEENGWDWLYHSHPGWPGWSPVLGQDPFDEKKPDNPTKTEQLLKSWMSKNQKPVFE